MKKDKTVDTGGACVITIADIAKVAETADLPAKSLGLLADLWWQKKEARLAADRESKKLKADEDLAYATLIAQFQKQEITAAGGKIVRVGMDPVPDYKPTVSDWTKYYAYIKEHDAWELLQRRPGEAAVKERWENGETIPGCDKFPVYKLTKQGV